jgi:hypothetical protein
MTLREKISDAIDATVEHDGRGGSITTGDTITAILAAIREHMTSPEAVERAAFPLYAEDWSNVNDPPEWEYERHRFTPLARAAILAALGGEP